jgi:hypothetical protein
MIDGYYAGYMTASAGHGMALLVFDRGTIAGADLNGVQFDGSYRQVEGGAWTGQVRVKIPPGTTVIQGYTAPPQGLSYDVPVSLPGNFLDAPYIELATPLGPVAMRLVKVREVVAHG